LEVLSMKKLISVVLSAILLLGLCLPALAVEDFDPPLWSEYGYQSLEEMLTDWDMTEDQYYAMVDEERLWREMDTWTDEQWDEYYAEQLQSEKNALGLIYELNVMYRNRPFSFESSEPVLVDNKLMLPVSCLESELGLTDVPEQYIVDIDGVSYFPARELEGFGYDVLWSDYYRTAVLLDRENIVTELNANFEAMNSVLRMGSTIDLTKNYKSSAKLDVDVTMFDTINGNNDYRFGIDTVVVENGQGAEMTINFDINSIVKALELLADRLYISDEELDEMTSMLDSLDGGMELILDFDNNMAYMRGDIVTMFASESGYETADGAWYSVDISYLLGIYGDYASWASLITDYRDITMGELIYSAVQSNYWLDPVFLYDAIVSDESITVLGDTNFEKRGTTWHCEQDLSELNEFVEAEGNFNIDISTDGNAATRIKGSLDYYVDMFISGVLTELDFNITPMKADMSGSFHVKNMMLIEFELNSTAAETNLEVPTAPPGGSVVISLD
jgi:hypothetical protein